MLSVRDKYGDNGEDSESSSETEDEDAKVMSENQHMILKKSF